MKLLSKLSVAAFNSLKLTDAFFGLPKAVADSVHFRCDWHHYFSSTTPIKKSLWIHGSSVGELEDLANFYLDEELLKSTGYCFEELVITSSSVSADAFLRRLKDRIPVAYAGPLPPENKRELNKFFERCNPDILILSHSDIWPLSLEIAQKKFLKHGIIWLPSHASSAKILLEKTIQPDKLCAIGARNEKDSTALRSRLSSHYTDSSISALGNPRIDRIIQRIDAKKQKDSHILETHRASPAKNKLSILVGSAWVEDAAILASSLKGLSQEQIDKLQIVVIPHVIDDIHLTASIQHLLPMARVISIQGILLEAYENFDLTFVGGGFRTGLHSILEPALWGLPVFCGPQLRKQPEASVLEHENSLIAVSNPQDLKDAISQCLESPAYLKNLSDHALRAASKLSELKGASQRLSALISQIRLSTR